jgi:Protein of unknown function (DUF2484)
MPVTLALVILWVLLVSATAMTPFPWHRRIAGFLLFVSFAILVAVAVEYGVIYAVLFFLAVASIYRKPLLYFWGKWRDRQRRREE